MTAVRPVHNLSIDVSSSNAIDSHAARVYRLACLRNPARRESTGSDIRRQTN